MTSKRLAPITQRRFANIEAHAFLAHRLYGNVNIRVRPIGVQSQGITMAVCKLLLRETAHCHQQLVGGGIPRHCENKFMHQLRMLAAHGCDVGLASDEFLEVEVPILNKPLRRSPALDQLAIFRLQ